MQANVSFTRARSAILAVGGLVCLITLSGCAGGGGGGGLSTLPAPFVYPNTLADAKSGDTVDGFMSPYAIDGSTSELVSVSPSVSGTTPSQGKISITINDIIVPQPPPVYAITAERGFTVTFDSNSTSGTLLWLSSSNNPFESLLTPCNSCLKTALAPATYISDGSSAGKVTFTYLDSAAMGLTYSALGLWTKPSSLSSSWPEVGGAFSAGVLTRGVDLPTTGSANYQGYLIGRYVTSEAIASSTFNGGYPAGSYIVAASASATADFGANAITSFSTTDTHIAPDSGGTAIAESRLNLSTFATLPINRKTTDNGNEFEGTAVLSTDTVSGVFTGSPGKIAGGFYGKPDTSKTPYAPPELGGSLSVTNDTGTQSMVGSFAMTKQ